MPRARRRTATPAEQAPAPVEAPAPTAPAEEDGVRSALRRATGTDNPALQNTLLNDLVASLGIPPGGDAHDTRGGAAIALMSAFQPRDAVEAMLAQQTVALNAAGMGALRRAANPTLPPEISSRLRRDAVNLFRATADMVEAVQAHRGAAVKQIVRVEHVTVEAGGQAVVGAVASGVRTAGGRGA